jgi:hypothetical protein
VLDAALVDERVRGDAGADRECEDEVTDARMRPDAADEQDADGHEQHPAHL